MPNEAIVPTKVIEPLSGEFEIYLLSIANWPVETAKPNVSPDMLLPTPVVTADPPVPYPVPLAEENEVLSYRLTWDVALVNQPLIGESCLVGWNAFGAVGVPSGPRSTLPVIVAVVRVPLSLKVMRMSARAAEQSNNIATAASRTDDSW